MTLNMLPHDIKSFRLIQSSKRAKTRQFQKFENKKSARFCFENGNVDLLTASKMSDWILAPLKPHNRVEWSEGCLTLTLEFIYNKKLPKSPSQLQSQRRALLGEIGRFWFRGWDFF